MTAVSWPARWVTGVVATFVVAMLPAVGLSAPAAAAACQAGTGVTVVVQGGGMNATTCVSGSGMTALQALQRAGYSTEGTARYGNSVLCRVNGYPGNQDCGNMPPASAYWALSSSSGNGSWTYSSSGVTSLTLGAGDWVGFRFGSGGSPSTTPSGPQPAPSSPPAPRARAAAGFGRFGCLGSRLRIDGWGRRVGAGRLGGCHRCARRDARRDARRGAVRRRERRSVLGRHRGRGA